MDARRAAGWGFLFFVALLLVVVGMLGRLGALLGAILTPDALTVNEG